jgi:hypothetical protein
VVTTCNDPPDSCTNAHRRTYAPTCTAAGGCGTERVVVDQDCSARATTCGPAGGNQAPAIQRYTAACDSNNPGQCVNGGTPQAPEYCQARGAVCSAPAGAGASVTTYVPACSGSGCADGGVAQGSPVPCGAAASTCGPNPNGPRGALQQITYTPACETGSSCFPNGRPNPQDCTASPGACSVDGNRALYTTYQAACNQAGTACVQGGNATRTYCDEVPTYCQNGAPVDTVNKCGNSGCEQQVGAVCPTDQRWVCSNSTTRRLQQGGCTYGNGCGYTDTATAQTCAAPRCVPPIEGNIFSSCGGCAVNSDGVAVCRSADTCTTCTNGCNQTTGLCNIRIIVPSPLGGVGTLGGVVSAGTAVVAPGAGLVTQ